MPRIRGSMWLSAVMFLAAAGCGPSGPAVVDEPATPAAEATDSPRVAVAPEKNADAAEHRETWEAYYIGDARVGYAHTTIEQTGAGDDAQVTITSENELNLQRFSQKVTQRVEISSVERPDGTPLSFTSLMQAGPVRAAARGSWQNGTAVIEVDTAGKTAKARIPWHDDYGGVFATEQSLRRKPLEPGEERQIKALIPLMNVMGEVRLKALDYETTPLLEGEARLLKVEQLTVIGPTRIDGTLWTDERGEIIKSYLPQLKQTSYRTSKEKALAPSTGGGFDLGTASVVKIARRIERPFETRSATYKASLTDGDIDGIFVSGPTQRVEAVDKEHVLLHVQAITPTEPAELQMPDKKPTKDDLQPNTLVQSDDEQVVAMAESVASDESDPWQLALALERYVHAIINKKNFSQTIASAAEVARSREGDCTEHAMLLAAFCRARKIPARCAMGLVYYAPAQGFAYHMWTEVWINDRWVPLDATLGRGGIGATHIKLAHSSLAGADNYSAFLPVFPVLGRLKLEVVEVK